VRPPHENRFVAVEPESGRRVQIEVFADGGRLRPPVRLAVGPVLHRDDLAADKVLAMWDRGEPRDYIDVTALLGVYGARELFALAAAKDAGLTADLLVDSLRRVHRFQTQDWTGVQPATLPQFAVGRGNGLWLLRRTVGLCGATS